MARGHDLDAWGSAEVQLAEAMAQDAGVTPISVVHASYYAMFHAARACLLRERKTAPKKHSSVVQQFGLLVKDRDESMRAAGRVLRVAKDLRIEADYANEGFVTVQQAAATRMAAVEFLELCAKTFGFARD